MVNFEVEVVGCNADVFESNYKQYVTSRHNGWFGDAIFELSAPQAVYDEIQYLTEECIEIL